MAHRARFGTLHLVQRDGHVQDDRLLVETDAPYLAPVPRRGKRNEPAFVRHVVERVAQIRKQPVEDVIEHTGANTARLFGWKAIPGRA